MERKKPCQPPTNIIESPVTVVAKAKEPVGESVGEPNGEFREASTQFNKSTTKKQRAEEGIFFTPKKARDLLFAKLAELGVSPKVVLEPSFGTGEFLHDARRIYTEATLLGVEKNEKLFASVPVAAEGSASRLDCGDFL
jgi:hypothetical protein